MFKLEAPCYIHDTPSTLLLSDTRPLRPTPSCQYVFNTLIDEVIWLILESLAHHQKPSQPRQIKTGHDHYDQSSHETQTVPSTAPSCAQDHGTSDSGSKITLPIDPVFLKTYGICKVLPHSLGREAILEAEIGWLEYQRLVPEAAAEEAVLNEDPSEVRLIDLFRELRVQCEILSPFAGNQQNTLRTGIPPSIDRKRFPNMDTVAGEIKGPGLDKLTNLVEHSIPLLLNPNAFQVQMRAYGDLYERPAAFLDLRHGPRGQICAPTILDARLMIYFVGVIQSFAIYLSKGVSRVVEREAARSTVKPQDLLVFIGEDERFWDLFELTRTKRFIERTSASNIGGSYHHRTGSFGIVSPDQNGSTKSLSSGIASGTFSTQKAQNSFAYLFKTHHLYVSALQVQAAPRPDAQLLSRLGARKSTDLPKRGQSSDIHRGSGGHFSTGSFSSPTTIPIQTALSPRMIVTALHPHPTHRKPSSRNLTEHTSTASSSSHHPIGSLEFLGSEDSTTTSLASQSRPSHEVEGHDPVTVRRAPSWGRRAGSSAANSLREVHKKKWSLSSTSNRDPSADSQTTASRRTDRSHSSTSTSPYASSPPHRKNSLTNLNQKFTSMIQAQAASSGRRSRSKTAVGGSVAKQSISRESDIGRLPPTTNQDELDRRADYANLSPRQRCKGRGTDLSSTNNSQSEETLDGPHLEAFEQLMTSGRTMKVSLTPGRFRFPADQSATDLPIDLSLSTSSFEPTSRIPRPITAPVTLQARTEPPPIRKKDLRSASSESRSNSGISSDDLIEDDDSDLDQRRRNKKDVSWQDMLSSEPPWNDEPGPAGLVSSFPDDSPQLGTNNSSKFSFAAFAIKKSGSSSATGKRRPATSSVNLGQIPEPTFLHSSTGHSLGTSAFKVNPSPKGRSASDAQTRGQHPRHLSQSALDQDVFPLPSESLEEGKTKRRGGFMSMIAKLKGKDDILASIKPVQPQFVASGVSGINPRAKAAGVNISSRYGSASIGSPPPLPTLSFYSQTPLRPRSLKTEGHMQVIRAQKSSPMMKIHIESKPEARSGTLSPKGAGFSKTEEINRRGIAPLLFPPPSTVDMRTTRSSFELSHRPSHSVCSLNVPDRLPPARVLQSWETEVETSVSIQRRPLVPALPPPSVTSCESYESQIGCISTSSTSRSSTRSNNRSPSRSSRLVKDTNADEVVPQNNLLTPPPTDYERSFSTPQAGLMVVVQAEVGKQRTITSGSNSSQASNQTIKLLEHSPSSNLVHPLLTPPHSPLENQVPFSKQSDEASSASTNASSLCTSSLTSRASSSTHTSCCTSEMRQDCGGSEEELSQAVYAEPRLSSPRRRKAGAQSRSYCQSEASGAESTGAVEEAPRFATTERGVEGFSTFKGAEPEALTRFTLVGEQRGEVEGEVMRATGQAWASINTLNRMAEKLNDLVDDAGGRVLVDIEKVMKVLEAEKERVEMELKEEVTEMELDRNTENVVGWLLDI